MRRLVALLFVLPWFGCGDGSPLSSKDPPWVGQYAASGTWDLGGPLAGGRTVGDAVADLLVAQIVSLTGVPSLLEDKAHEYVDKAIREHVKAVVDPYVPADLAPGGSVYQVLAASLAKVDARSDIVLAEGLMPGSMKGSETFTALEYEHGGKTYKVTAADLGAGVSIEAEWSGDESGDSTLEVKPHGVSIQFGALVQMVAAQVIDAAGQTDLKNQVQSAVACDQIVALIVGSGQGLEISLSDWSYTVDTADLTSACNSAATLLKDRALGMFALDSKLEVGGDVSWQASGGTATGLTSAAGFGGILTVAPPAIAPRVTVAFSATRN